MAKDTNSRFFYKITSPLRLKRRGEYVKIIVT